MENEKQESQPKTENNEELVRNPQRKMTMKELCEKHGIPYRNTTMEHIGKTLVMPYYMPKEEPKTDDEITDSWEAFTRYANQRKGSKR